MISRVFHEWERRLAAAASDRTVRPFEWGLEWIDQIDGHGAGEIEYLERWADSTLAASDDFFAVTP